MPNQTIITLNSSGTEVKKIHANLSKLGFIISKQELDAQIFGQDTRNALLTLQKEYKLPRTGAIDEVTKSALSMALAGKKSDLSRVEGRIFFENGLPAEGITLRLYNWGFGGSEKRISEAKSGKDGFYVLKYDLGGKAANIEIRALDAIGKEISLSTTKFNAAKWELLNLVAPNSIRPLAPEYQRLSADLKKQLGSLRKLADAKEDAERRDLTVLNRATGWDARLIVLACKAEKLSADPDINLTREVLYSLFRVGLPSDKKLLAQTNVESVGQALETARKVGIVKLSDKKVKDAKAQFEKFARKTRLAARAPGSSSTYNQLLEASGLSSETQEKFASIFFNHRGDADQLWKAAIDANISPAEIQTLQLQGKLAFLAGNSAEMTSFLLRKVETSDPVQLVDDDFFQADKWVEQINSLAGIPPERRNSLTTEDKDSLQALIPTAYLGESIEKRRSAYAEDMARKVRLSYPTQVVCRIIEQDTANSFKLGDARYPTAKLLENAAAMGFRLGQTPVEHFLKTYPEVLNGIDPKEIQTAKEGVKTIQRIYQITPGNEAMSVLLSQGFDSAFDLVVLPFEDYMKRYGNLFPSLEQAELVYRKAEQVSAMIYNWFAITNKLESEVPVQSISDSAEVRKTVKEELIKIFPTIESLFGSLDFCECEHCRSVLSPAAYLVDLLQFLDKNAGEKAAEEWKNTLLKWSKEHNGASYPFRDPEDQQKFLDRWKRDHPNEGEPDTQKTPYEVLIERRPDIPNIQLTCENTNTALPYIDVVNEILEYYAANDKLDSSAVHDTGSATTSELLAEPQYVFFKAYEKLQKASYPLTLPFDLWLEIVRSFCDYFEVPLWHLLEVFRPSDELFVKTQGYDRSAVFAESLGLSPYEYALFTDPKMLDKWYELYGYKTAAEATDEATDEDTNQRIDLNSAKALSRRLGVTYKELVDIVRAGFVNPKLESLVILHKLGITVNDLMLYKSNWDFYEQNRDLLIKDRNTWSSNDLTRFNKLTKEKWQLLNELHTFIQLLEELGEKYQVSFQAAGFDSAKAWLDEELEKIDFDQILVLADPDAGCNFDQTILRHASARKADDIAFLKINLFVRIWRKLGWTIEETDRALQVFLPKNCPFDKGHLYMAPLKTALLYLSHLKMLEDKVSAASPDRLKLITLWSNITTTGKNPLYAQLFLTPSILKNDEIFDDPLGSYLQPSNLEAIAKLRWHNVSKENVPLDKKIDDSAFAEHKEISLQYDILQEVQHLTYQGILSDADKEQLGTLYPSPILKDLLDAVQIKAREFTLIKGHLLTLQGALGLTANDITDILTDLKTSIESADLSLAYVSHLYRYGLLSKLLNLSIRDLISLKNLSGLDPFKPLSNNPVMKLDEDYPFTQTLSFVEVAGQIRDSGFRIDDLDYLLRHRFDPTGKYRPKSDATLALIKKIADGVRAIYIEHAIPSNKDTVSEDGLRKKLGLVLAPDVVERFLSMIKGTAEFTAIERGVKPENQLKEESFISEPSIRQVKYNDMLYEQRLTFKGVIFDAQKEELKARFVSDLLGNLLDDVQAQAQSFFDNNLRKQRLRLDDDAGDYEAGFIENSDFKDLFEPMKQLVKISPNESQKLINEKLKENEMIEQENEKTLQGRWARAINAFLPFLQRCLIRQLVVQTLTAETGADRSLVESLLTDARLLREDQPVGDSQSLMSAFSALGERGINATFFSSSDGTGPVMKSDLFADIDTALKDKDNKPLKPELAKSASFEGYLEVPTSGVYRFFLAFSKKDINVKLRFCHIPDTFLEGKAVENAGKIEEISNCLELKSGLLYRFELKLDNLGEGEVRLLVHGETLPKAGLAQLTLYPMTVIKRVEYAQILLNKTLQIIQNFNLNEREVSYLLMNPKDFGGLDLSKLPVIESYDVINRERALFSQFLRLAGYAKLKQDLAGGTDDLIGIFETKEIDEKYSLIAKQTRRDEISIKATANSLSKSDFANEIDLQQLWGALQIVERFGVPVNSIYEWTKIVNVKRPDQRIAIARDLKEALKARFEPKTWQQVARPIFDRLRQQQRDALVAYIMHKHGFDRMEQLYEYFLIDPGMEPVVQTSRIRLAIGSVQLFIQRCLLNMEIGVHPTAINAKQWEWMKRYRVWEANRKIFLFPENWLDPEFRDDKTYLFKELEGSLLQGDVSNDLVEDAFLNYLKKLEDLARLDIVAMHLEDYANPALNTLHVIGRTYSNSPQYFYRRNCNQTWTPWEPVTAEIQGDHLAPVVWRNRLYLFWVTFMDKPDVNATQNTEMDEKPSLAEENRWDIKNDLEKQGKIKLIDVQLHWCEYLQGGWSPCKSSEFVSLGILWAGRFYPLGASLNFDPRSIFIYVSKEYEKDEEKGVYINLYGVGVYQAFHIAGRNTRPELVPPRIIPDNPYSPKDVYANRYSWSGRLDVTFKQRITTEEVKPPETITLPILSQSSAYTLLPCDNDITFCYPEIASLVKPVFYQREGYEETLYIEPSLEEQVIEEWRKWVPPPQLEFGDIGEIEIAPPDMRDEIVRQMIPKPKPYDIGPGDPGLSINPESRFKIDVSQDWLVNTKTVTELNGVLIGPRGWAELNVQSASRVDDAVVASGVKISVNAGIEIAPESVIFAKGKDELEQAGLKDATLGMNIVGSGGLNSALVENIATLNSSKLSAVNSSSELIER
jgi:hypothetical protein